MDESLALPPVLVTNVHRTTLNGREYVVGDVTILREGVLPGSKGPYFYPLAEIVQKPGIWNAVLLTANHPMENGVAVSARSPQVAAKYGIGYFFNDTIDVANKARKGQVWVDVELANRIDNRIVPAIIAGRPINVSTGLYTSDEAAVANSNHNGIGYTHIARNYQPDHLAILLDEKGACSIKDGCGINVNKANYPEKCPYCGTPLEIDPDSGVCNRCNKKVSPVTNQGDNVNRDQTVAWLTTNCDCWKGKAEILNNDKNFTEDDLKKLKTNAEATTLVVNTLKEIGTTLGAPKDANVDTIKTLTKNAADAAAEKKKSMEDEEDKKKKDMKNNTNTNTGTEPDFKTNFLNTLKSLTSKEYADNAPDDVKKLLANAESIVDQKRIEVINKLTANIANVEERKAKILKLKDKPLETLNEYLEYAQLNNQDTKTEEDKFLANFFQGDKNPTKVQPTNNNKKDILLPSLAINANEEVVEEYIESN